MPWTTTYRISNILACQSQEAVSTVLPMYSPAATVYSSIELIRSIFAVLSTLPFHSVWPSLFKYNADSIAVVPENRRTPVPFVLRRTDTAPVQRIRAVPRAADDMRPTVALG